MKERNFLEELERKNQEIKIEKSLHKQENSKKDTEMKFLLAVLDDFRKKHNDIVKGQNKPTVKINKSLDGVNKKTVQH